MRVADFQRGTCRLVFGLLMIVGSWSGGTIVFASDHWNLEEQMPAEVEDAYASDYLVPELHSVVRYERARHGGDGFVLIPRFGYGFARNWHARIAAPFLLGSTDKTGSGDTELEVFHNFQSESLYIPALAWIVSADLPTGRNSNGIDTRVKLIATKALGDSYLLHRLHLNLAWNHNADPTADERRDRYSAILGYSHLLPDDTVLVMDVVREQELEKSKTDNIVEAGIRRMLMPSAVLSLGVGAGIGPDSPDFRLTIGFQYSF